MRRTARPSGDTKRLARRALAIAGLALMAAPQSGHALTIVPQFNANLSASSKITIQNAINFYQSTFSDPITVAIGFFNMATGIASSVVEIQNVQYIDYSTALFGDRTSPDDAIANVLVSTTDPVNGNVRIRVTSANQRAIGLAGAQGNFGNSGDCTGLLDGCIGLNLSATNDAAGPYSLFALIEREINEVLGLGSALNGTQTPNTIRPSDLFRFSAAAARSYGANSSCAAPPTAYFSANNGTTNLGGFNNCNNGGDYGGWIAGGPSQVQDAVAQPSTSPTLGTMSPEVRQLDVIGYSITGAVITPEPSTYALMAVGLGAIGMVARRRRNTKPL